MLVRIVFMLTMALVVLPASQLTAHEGHSHAGDEVDSESHAQSSALIMVLNTQPTLAFSGLLQRGAGGSVAKPEIAQHFEHFENVKTRWDANTLYIESNGLPNHNMMVGIRSWQQQVPLPQPFTGANAWKIPLQPQLASKPINAKTTSFRGAIAVAVNGVPIFSALNNRGVDAFLAGELDEWGGHCGRGDDYHYHIAPLHLERIVGKGNPIAFALDGFPIYGLTEADGSPVGELDELNGQFDTDGNYHYHATKTYPYINGGVRGAVDFRNGEIASQPKDSPVRPGQPPLRGATITKFESNGQESVLTYQIRGQEGTIRYASVSSDSYKFTYNPPGGNSWTETYQRRARDNRGGSDRRPPPPPSGGRPPRGPRRPQ